MARPQAVYNDLQKLQERFLQASLGKDALLQMISEAEVSEQVYNSNAIENSTLTLEETDRILLEIDLDRYITERELFETKNLARVVSYIDTKAESSIVNFDLILLLHKMLLSNIRDDVAGRFRNTTEWVRVGSHIALAPEKIEEALQKMLITYATTQTEHIVKRIALFHLTFEHIHPFVDGNGRIGRVLNNLLLIKDKHVPINIKFIDRKRYYKALNEFDTSGKTAEMEDIIAKALTNSYHKRLAYLESKEIVDLKEFAKRTNQSHSNVINKAKRQTIGAFIEKGKWKIGI